jgi:hypothetical protein
MIETNPATLIERVDRIEAVAKFLNTNIGAPTDGTSGTLAGHAPTGALLIDTENAVLYVNAGTKASPVWFVIGNQST